MREKLQTLPLSELKELAKSQGIKGISSLRKAEIIDLLCREAEEHPQVKPAEVKRAETRGCGIQAVGAQRWRAQTGGRENCGAKGRGWPG